MRRYDNLKIKYEALGFVEALVAIMVVGISSVVLMQIAVNTMQNTIQNEIIDNMTQYAVEGAEIAQEIANREATSGEDVFPDKVDWGRCFVLKNEEGVYGFLKETNFESYSEEERNEYKNVAIIDGEDTLFRVICLESSSSSEDATFAIAKVIVGQTASKGDITKGNFVKDYSYLTVIKL
jgi:hypothetical protein